MKPLEGIRALEVTGFLAGPLCGQHLANLGAEVVRIEPPAGDQNRQWAPFLGPEGIALDRQTDQDLSLMYLMRAHGRRGITLNLKTERGQAIFKQLAAQVDVVFENLSPGSMASFGLDYPALREVNPRLVYCSISGFGQTGPYRDYPAFDPVIQAMSGMMALIGGPDAPPTRTGVFYLVDQITPLFAAIGILSALRQRDVTGEGQSIDASMLDCMVSMLWMEPLGTYDELGIPLRIGNAGTRHGPMNAYPTLDGWILIVAASQPGWEQLARAVDRADLLDDPRFTTGVLRARHQSDLDVILRDWTSTRTSADALGHLRSRGIVCGPINFPADVEADPHVLERGVLAPVRHPTVEGAQAAALPRFPIVFSGSETGADPPRAPVLGADNEAILGGWLGLSPADLDALRGGGVI